MIFEINNLRVRADDADAFEAAFRRAAPLLLSVAGCRSARLLRCVEQPGRYQIEIGWDRLEDHCDHYPHTAQAEKVRALLLPMIGSADLAHFEIVLDR